jgi:uncharacterized membrane protein YfcA
MTIVAALLTVLFIGFSSFLETTVGFGFGIVSMPLMSLILPPKAAVLYVTVAALLQRPILMWNTRHDFQPQVLAAVVPGLIIGTIPGSYVLKIISSAQLKIILGLLLLVALLLMFYKVKLPVHNLTRGRFGAGFGAGVLGASTSMCGPPIAVWFANEDMPKQNMRGNMIWIFALVNFLTLVAGYFMGTLHEIGDWHGLLYTLPGLIIGYGLGLKFITKVNQQLFTRIIQVLIAFGAISLLIGGFNS